MRIEKESQILTPNLTHKNSIILRLRIDPSHIYHPQDFEPTTSGDIAPEKIPQTPPFFRVRQRRGCQRCNMNNNCYG